MVEWNVSFPSEGHTSIIVSSGGEFSLPYGNTETWNLFNVELWI